jgi:hypothetical protein
MTRFSVLADAAWLTPERVRRIALVFGFFALLIIGGDAWLHTRAGVTDMAGQQLGRDFVNYWAGAHLAAKGHAARVYDIPAFVRYERMHTAANAAIKWYSYPPVALVLSLPLAALGFVPALIVWLLSGGLICSALLARSLDWRMAFLAAFATPAALMNALSGQNGQFSAALLCGGIIFVERRPWLAGLLFGMLCFKPHLAILVPVALAAGGFWRSFAGAALTVAALCAAVFLLGADAWTGFLQNAPINAALLEHGEGFWNRMPSLFAAVRLLGGGVNIAYGAQMVSAVAATWFVIRIWRGAASLAMKGAALVTATFLVTPYAWDYDLVSLTFAVVWFITEAARTGFRPWEKIALAAMITMPLFLLSTAKMTHLQTGPLFLWAVLLLIARRAVASVPRPVVGRDSLCAKTPS